MRIPEVLSNLRATPVNRVLLVVGLFGLLGLTLALSKSQASSFTVARDAETGILAGAATEVSLPDASGSVGVRFGGGSTGGGNILTVAKTGAQYDSIQTAATAAQPGDTILIAGGTYSEALNPSSGAQDLPITFQARAGQKVIVDGNNTNQSGSGLVNLDTRSWIKFSGITFTNSPAHGIYGFQANDITFENCEISNSADGGLVMLGSANIKVDSCNIHHNNLLGLNASHEAVTMGEATTNYEIARCNIHDNVEEGVAVKFDSNSGSIHDNTIYNNREANVYANSVSNVEIYNNTIYSTAKDKKTGIVVGIEDESSTRQASNIRIYNNILYNNLDGAINFWRQSTGVISNISIINNTIADNPGGGIIGVDQLAATGNVARNNIFFSNPTGISSPLANENNFTDDPRFVNAAAHNYHLQAGSGAIDGGSSADAPAFDRDNKARPQGGGIDIGAYEQ